MELETDQPFDLVASLESGQAHRWRREEEWHSAVVWGNIIKMRQVGRRVEFCCEPSPESQMLPHLQRYFRLDDDLAAIYDEISRDSRVATMVARYPGLRLLRLEPWECVVSFICSANSNIPRIHQNVEKLAETFGDPIGMDGQVHHAFPTPAQLDRAGEAKLRELGLGFRAPYVAAAARLVAEGNLDLDALIGMPHPEAKALLMECPGIGPKIADCIAVFSLEKLEAFPIDVWVRRALAEWYFPDQKKPTDRVLLEWAQNHFGRYGGYSQQYLFHGRRLER